MDEQEKDCGLTQSENGRPKWVMTLWRFVNDEIIDEAHGFPMDGTHDELHDLIETAVNDVLCSQLGHDFIDDMCMKPEHRYCVYCGRLEQRVSYFDRPLAFDTSEVSP